MISSMIIIYIAKWDGTDEKAEEGEVTKPKPITLFISSRATFAKTESDCLISVFRWKG